ncbi:MAG: hypothetical protein E6J61_08470 [Deltaproteobacteria bacterium]|nr:MAG: hypothetical protein E6J61_08470 [Deltaproteobacteria bacterium]
MQIRSLESARRIRNALHEPRIGIAAETRYFEHRQPAALGLALLAAGHEAEFLDPADPSLPDLDLSPPVVKPVFGDNARDVRVVRDRAELLSLQWHEPSVIAQPYLPSAGFDLKLYVAREEERAVKKPSPLATGSEAVAHPVLLTPALRDLALRCGVIFGLDLYGVDCIETPEGPVVIEVNDFPNYSGTEGMDASLARFVVDRARFTTRRGEQK